MAYAMATIVTPKARATPRRPIPTCGNAAARTALPQPPRTSQKVPMNSAASFRVMGITDSCLFVFFLDQRPGGPYEENTRIRLSVKPYAGAQALTRHTCALALLRPCEYPEKKCSRFWFATLIFC